MTSQRLALLLTLTSAACSTSTSTDGGVTDLGGSDLGGSDLGHADLGLPDLGPPDAGSVDGPCSTDADGDGHVSMACGGDDCDDADPNRYPTHTEVCDSTSHDEDCDPHTFGTTDGDADGYVATSCCNADGTAMHCGDDCDDGNPNIHPTQAEVCNGLDDDCDGMVDDIIHGTIVCRMGDSHACTTACGGSGTASCSATCLGFDACTGPEVCNGCDDNNDGATDDGFACARAALGTCTVPACGSPGTRTCDGTCNWGTCSGPEICNYCDDNLDGNFNEEKPFATASASDHFSDCSGAALIGPGTSCDATIPTPSGFDLWATLLDGTAVPQAGALWLTPSGWVQGWGPMDVDVTLEVTAVSAGSPYELPLGGWTVVIAHGGTPDVGPANANGLPAAITGIGARWFWSQFNATVTSPPYAGDSTRGFAPGPQLRADSAASTTDWGDLNGDLLMGGSPGLDGPGPTLTQRMHITYTPDDPTTVANEETLVVVSTASDGSTTMSTPQTYRPVGAQRIGTGPLMIGITAGTFTQSGFSSTPPGSVFGVPVRARAHIFRQDMLSMGRVSFTYTQTMSRAGLCP